VNTVSGPKSHPCKPLRDRLNVWPALPQVYGLYYTNTARAQIRPGWKYNTRAACGLSGIYSPMETIVVWENLFLLPRQRARCLWLRTCHPAVLVVPLDVFEIPALDYAGALRKNYPVLLGLMFKTLIVIVRKDLLG